jgi:hypothetical protein
MDDEQNRDAKKGMLHALHSGGATRTRLNFFAAGGRIEHRELLYSIHAPRSDALPPLEYLQTAALLVQSPPAPPPRRIAPKVPPRASTEIQAFMSARDMATFRCGTRPSELSHSRAFLANTDGNAAESSPARLPGACLPEARLSRAGVAKRKARIQQLRSALRRSRKHVTAAGVRRGAFHARDIFLSRTGILHVRSVIRHTVRNLAA